MKVRPEDRELYFVTLNWNTTDLLCELVESVEATTTIPHKWLILDNGSDADNWAGLQNWLAGRGKKGIECNLTGKGGLSRWGNTYVVRSHSNLGCVIGHNRCFDVLDFLTKGYPYEVIMTDTDVVLTEYGWLSCVLEWANEHPGVGIVGLEHGRDERCAGAVFLDTNGNWYIHGPQLYSAEPAEGESVGLGLAFLRWPIFDNLLRFDAQTFRLYYKQDDDLCFQVRARLALEVWAYPIGCIHAGSGSLKINDYEVGDVHGWDAFDKVKQANQQAFTVKWRWLLEDRRRNMAGERKHLDEMRERMHEWRHEKFKLLSFAKDALEGEQLRRAHVR